MQKYVSFEFGMGGGRADDGNERVLRSHSDKNVKVSLKS